MTSKMREELVPEGKPEHLSERREVSKRKYRINGTLEEGIQ
jgi:hypothetical protein